MRKIRLDRLLSENGCSRKQARELARTGRVWVNGMPVADGARLLDADLDQVTLDGCALRTSRHIHLMINKPAGYLTATEDARDATVLDLLPEEMLRKDLGPVGRLDKDVTGLVLMTTDGQLAHRLISPKWSKDKIYVAEVEGLLTQQAVDAFLKGVQLKDFTARPAGLKILSSGNTSRCEITVQEGKFHQVKRMLAAVGHPVIALHRRNIAGIELDPLLASGEYRELTAEEVKYLYEITHLEGAS